ncbi:shikimate kinase [Propionicimonas sp.]|uniref:shikimate kinase n=1 Tax=Propionicimonas sp. TaxID=1955623 RepID=UPI0039E4A03A
MTGPDLVLVGIPGSGKSTVAEVLAERWGVPLVDVDRLVEDQLGSSAEEFFAGSGEAAYREIEERASLAALAGPGVVVLGSGAVDLAPVRAALAGSPVVWLRASVATVTRRLGMNTLGMEALVAIRDRLGALLAGRAPLYEAVATLAVDTDRRSAAEVADAISRARSVG